MFLIGDHSVGGVGPKGNALHLGDWSLDGLSAQFHPSFRGLNRARAVNLLGAPAEIVPRLGLRCQGLNPGWRLNCDQSLGLSCYRRLGLGRYPSRTTRLWISNTLALR